MEALCCSHTRRWWPFTRSTRALSWHCGHAAAAAKTWPGCKDTAFPPCGWPGSCGCAVVAGGWNGGKKLSAAFPQAGGRLAFDDAGGLYAGDAAMSVVPPAPVVDYDGGRCRG